MLTCGLYEGGRSAVSVERVVGWLGVADDVTEPRRCWCTMMPRDGVSTEGMVRYSLTDLHCKFVIVGRES